MTFKYDVGQAVEYRPTGGSVGLYRVVRRMPEEDNAVDRKYRIKGHREGFERTVLECDLTASSKPESLYATVVPLRRNTGSYS